MEHVLLVWDNCGEFIDFYLIPHEHEMADIAEGANGIYINSNNKEGDCSEQISEWIDSGDAEVFKIETGNIKSIVSGIYISGFVA